MSTAPSKKDWIERIVPHLSTSLRSASDEITRTEAVQEWLHDASMEAAAGLGDVSGVQGQMQGYMRMMDRLEEQFPALLDAVDDLTDGYGRVDLHWRPMNPNFSRLYIAFDQEYTVTLFTRLAEPTIDAAQAAVQTVADALPEGSPFPNRPNTVTGLVAFEGRGLGVQVSERLSDNHEHLYRTVTLRPEEREALDKLSPEEAMERLLNVLAPTGSSQSGG